MAKSKSMTKEMLTEGMKDYAKHQECTDLKTRSTKYSEKLLQKQTKLVIKEMLIEAIEDYAKHQECTDLKRSTKCSENLLQKQIKLVILAKASSLTQAGLTNLLKKQLKIAEKG